MIDDFDQRLQSLHSINSPRAPLIDVSTAVLTQIDAVNRLEVARRWTIGLCGGCVALAASLTVAAIPLWRQADAPPIMILRELFRSIS